MDALHEVENLLASSIPKKEPKKNALVARSPRSTNLGLNSFNKELEDLKTKMFKDHALVRDFWGKEMAIEVRGLELTKAKIELQKKKSKERQEHT